MIEKKLQEVHDVVMVDGITNSSVPLSTKKLKYKKHERADG